MKLPPFEYRVAGSVDEAVGLLAEWGDEAKVLAGGQSLVPLLSFRLARPSVLIDINRIPELGHITDGPVLELGATVRHRQAELSGVVRDRMPLVAEALGYVGHAAIRNRGTVGGSIAHSDPSAEMPTVLFALGGEVVVQSTRGQRTIGADEFMEGFLTTTLEPDELLTAVRFPTWPAPSGWAFNEFSRRSGDYAIVGVAALLGLGVDGRIARAALVFSGVGGTPERAQEAEQALVGQSPTPDLWDSVGKLAGAGLDPASDLHGSAAYRRHLAGVLATRSLSEAFERAGGERA
jgi:carbon-monoxide dehydrogenase medium subunit